MHAHAARICVCVSVCDTAISSFFLNSKRKILRELDSSNVNFFNIGCEHEQLNILNKTAVDCPEPTPRAETLNVEMVLGLHVTLTTGGCDRDVWSLESFVVHRA